jgi:predicted lipoprotein with Yx(FWY)xxD motif
MATYSLGRIGLGAAGASAVVALVAACANSSSPGTPAGGGASSMVQRPSVMRDSAGHLNTASTSIGTVLVDGSGRTVYELVGDSPAKQTCTGACLAVWPAVMVNGHQVVVNGHPAFTYVRDTSAGQTNGQNVTDHWGRWLALDPKGDPIGASAAQSSKRPSSPSSSSKAAPSGGGPAF